MFRTIAVLLAVVGLGQTGCRREPHTQSYTALTGVVTETNPGTGEISIAPRMSGADPSSVELCLMTRDSEIYIDDRLGSIEDVQVGDRIAMVGYSEREPQPKHFIISYGRIRRSSPPAKPPDFIEAILNQEAKQRDK